MKNLLLTALAIVALTAPAVSSAQIGNMTPSNHPIYDVTNTKVIGYVPNANWDRDAVEAARRNDPNTKLIALVRGQSVKTIFGYVDTCPTWYPVGCVIDPALVVN